MSYSRAELRFNGWGLSRVGFDTHGRDAELWRYVAEALGMAELPSTPARALEELEMPEPALSEKELAELADIVGEDGLATDRFERAFHAYGKSYYDLLRIRAGDVTNAPDAVIYPKDHDAVQRALAWAAEHEVAVVPFGGGSSVVGGVEARRADGQRATVTLDTTRMRSLLELDETSHLATFQTGVYGPELEEVLGARGYTVGHFPQSFEFSTLGGWIAARGSGQQSNRYGGAAKMLVGARLATPNGEWRTEPFPSSAAGPDLNHLVAGSEGVLGVITEATVKVHEKAEARDFVSFLFRDFESGADAVRAVTQAELPVATLRLSDVDETRFYSELRNVLEPSRAQQLGLRALGNVGFDKPCVLMVGFEGAATTVARARRAVLATCTRKGGLYVGRSPGRSWYARRFSMPYLRDPLMDHGVGIDTLETSTTWANVPRLYDAVSRAIRGALEGWGTPGILLAHISHTYSAGTSLYFTFLFRRDLDDEIGQWKAVKAAASDAISASGGTISHHHGVGTDHAPWLEPEKGSLGVGLIEAAKARLDPAGVMNPGKLLPD